MVRRWSTLDREQKDARNNSKYKCLLRYKKRNKNFIRAYKEFMGCSRCSENRPVCLHFHHKKQLKRRWLLAHGWTLSQIRLLDVSHLVRMGASPRAILRQMKKCELLCANCHMVETYG